MIEPLVVGVDEGFAPGAGVELPPAGCAELLVSLPAMVPWLGCVLSLLPPEQAARVAAIERSERVRRVFIRVLSVSGGVRRARNAASRSVISGPRHEQSRCRCPNSLRSRELVRASEFRHAMESDILVRIGKTACLRARTD